MTCPPPGAADGVGVAFGPCLHCWITKPSRQSVFSFHRFVYLSENFWIASCWFWDWSAPHEPFLSLRLT